MSLLELSRPVVVTVKPRESARAAARLMQDHKVGALVVTDAERRPIGVVTDRDLALCVLAEDRDPEEVTVERCMSDEPATLHRDADVIEAARFVRRSRVRRIPLVDDDGAVVGLVSVDDILSELAGGLHRASETPTRGYIEEGRRKRVVSVLGSE